MSLGMENVCDPNVGKYYLAEAMAFKMPDRKEVKSIAKRMRKLVASKQRNNNDKLDAAFSKLIKALSLSYAGVVGMMNDILSSGETYIVSVDWKSNQVSLSERVSDMNIDAVRRIPIMQDRAYAEGLSPKVTSRRGSSVLTSTYDNLDVHGARSLSFVLCEGDGAMMRSCARRVADLLVSMKASAVSHGNLHPGKVVFDDHRAYVLDASRFRWGKVPNLNKELSVILKHIHTENSAMFRDQVEDALSYKGMSLYGLACSEDQERNPKSNRCRKKCKPGYARNPSTGRCVRG